jgi:hypothetical protein|tara:strand:+ start:1460 stop:1861 length:402 start_codon:yes stop_codon:yes gene_type:complete
MIELLMSSFSFTPELKKELQTLQQNLGQETRNLKDSRITHLETEIKLLSQRVNNLVSMDILKQKKRARENNMNRILLKQMMTENRKLRDDYRDLNLMLLENMMISNANKNWIGKKQEIVADKKNQASASWPPF